MAFFANPEIRGTSRPQITVTGIVSNGEGPLEGATVQVEGNSIAVTTNASGAYTIGVPGNGTLVFSFSGYIEKKSAVNNQSTINVTLEKDPKQLEDIVVVGYRTQKRGTVTGAVNTIKSAELENVPVDNLSNALSGRLTGVTVTQAAGTPGMSSSIRIRSNGTFNNNDALYVIDGVVSDKFAFDGLTPNEVESVTVLNDGASAAACWHLPAHCVVLVAAKRGRAGYSKPF